VKADAYDENPDKQRAAFANEHWRLKYALVTQNNRSDKSSPSFESSHCFPQFEQSQDVRDLNSFAMTNAGFPVIEPPVVPKIDDERWE